MCVFMCAISLKIITIIIIQYISVFNYTCKSFALMNLVKINQEITDFSQRIVKTLKLLQCKQGMLASQKKLSSWIRQQSERLKKMQETGTEKQTGFLVGSIKKIFKKQPQKKQNPYLIDFNILCQYVKKGVIPKNYNPVSLNLPEDIKAAIEQLKGKKWQKYYGFVKGPFMSDYFIVNKQDFHSIIQSVQVNQLKFLMIEQKVAHKYQRNLVQQIFGRIFREKGALSLVIKVEVNFDPLQPPYNIFCYIEDMKLHHQINWKPAPQLQKNFNELQIKDKNKTLKVLDLNVLQIFLAQILVLPLQSLVSDFIVQVRENDAQLIKYNEQTQQEIIKQKSLKQHPSLRNPLMYFRQYIDEHSIKISQIQKVTSSKELYACFYKCLEIVINLILTDFETEVDQTVAYSSICFNLQVFSALWITFHKINLLSGWMKEVIQPVKDTITIREVISHFCPIFNEISVYETNSFQNFRQFFLNLQMENYLATIVKKNSLQKYKDMYVTDRKSMISKKLSSAADIYSQIFRPILHEVNILYSDPVEACYILNFCCKFYFQYQPIFQQIQQRWRNPEIWEKCVKTMQKSEVPFIDIGFDFMAYACGVDTFSIDTKSFQRVKYTTESTACLQGLQIFINYIQVAFQENSTYILASLLQKAFKHKKFKLCKLLLQKKVQIKDFKQIIKSQQYFDELNLQTKQNILKTIQIESPQMHRLYKWQQLMIVHLKEQKEDSFQINTLQFGKCYIPRSVIQTQIKKNKVINNLSRKDCRFNSNRQISFVHLSQGVSFYIQSNQFPLMPYFYKIFFAKLGIPEIMFNFTSFFHENKIFYITEALREGVNYRKGLLTYTQEELNSMTDLKLISEAIILSMILIPGQIQLRDIYICPKEQEHGEIFIIDWHSFYQKNFMCRYSGKTKLNTCNSLFLMNIMNHAVHPSIMKKYANLDVMKICQSVFIECKNFSQQMNKLYKNQRNVEQPSKQLLAMIFQSGFIFNLAERMFKIKRAFNIKSSMHEKGISYYKILEILHSETSYYYQQAYSTNIMLRERELVLSDQNWKRSFLHISIIQFFGMFRKIQQTQYLFPDNFYKFCFQGPTQSLADITINLNKFKAFSEQNPEIFANYSNEQFQYIMKNIDLSIYDINTRSNFLQIIKNKSLEYLDSEDKRVLPLSFISLKSVQGLKQTYLDNFSFERVQQLVIQKCKLDAFDIRTAPKTIGNIMYLQLKDIRGIRYLGQNTISGHSFQIKHLKTLSIINCHDLISIDLKCDILECLQLRNNEQLETVYVHSLNLKNINIYNNPNINLQNIGIYIIKGINVLMSRSSCRGDISKLYSATYEKYVNNILKYLLVSFFVRQQRYRILLTLCKMKEVSDELFTRAGVTSLRPFSSIFRRFTIQVQNHLLSEIFRLYFCNPYLNEITIGQFMIDLNKQMQQISLQRIFKVVSSGIASIKHHKPFHCLKFQKAHQIFENLQKIQVKTLVDLIKMQKYFVLSIQNINIKSQKAESTDKQIQLIRYLSMQKDDIEKMTLTLKESLINVDFLCKIFKGTFTLQEMKKQEEKMFESKLKSRLSRLTSARSINEEYPKHMKINRLTLQNCLIQDKQQLRRFVSLPQSTEFVQLKQSQQKVVQKTNLNSNTIKCNILQMGSIKQIILNNCTLQSFSILGLMPNLMLIRLSKCKIQDNNYNKFFNILKSIQVGTLDLEYFFDSSLESEESFNSFCEILKNVASLRILKLNKNCFTFGNVLNLNQIINDTAIQQLELDQVTIIQKNLRHKISYEDERIQLISSLRQKKEEKIAVKLRQFMRDTKNLKSLTIQLSSLKYIEQFIKSVSENKSIVFLKLNTNHEIPSSLLVPLNKNQKLTDISSNMQLPMWLLNHVSSNRNTEKKNNIFLYDQNDDSLLNALNNTMASGSKTHEYYKLGLSLDGGGMRGMLLATQLQYLTQKVGYPLHKIFDCIGGTSIGGILALLSTGTLDGYNPVLPNQQLTGLFTKFGQDIFKKSQFRQLRNLFQTKYSPASYEQVLKNYFKDCRLSNCLQETSVIVTAVNRVDNKDYVFRSMEALLDREKDFYMRDIARATSAAPTYFPSAQIKNVNASIKLSLIDGGIGLNNPSKLVIDQVKKISANAGAPQNYFLLSLGTGKLPSQNIPQSAGLKDISPIIDSYAQSSNYFLERDLSINYKGHFFRVSPSINIKDKNSAQLDNTSDQIIDIYRNIGLQASKKFFNNTVIFGKYRNMNLIEWLRENTARKYQF